MAAALAGAVWIRSGTADAVRVEAAPVRVVSPASGASCADVAGSRACWDEGATGPACAGGRCLVDRPVPPSAPPSAWRCGGEGAARVCELRARRASAFECDGGACVQAYPRAPDDGQWECVDMDGVVYCHGGSPAAGVVAGAPDLGWICGARRGKDPPERVCVDLSPDFPETTLQEQEPTSGKCDFDYLRGVRRTCKPGNGTRIGDACSVLVSCPRGAECAGGRCLPPRPAGDCWFDDDCPSGQACLWGTCAQKEARKSL